MLWMADLSSIPIKLKSRGLRSVEKTGLKKDHMNCFVHEIYAIVTFILN